MNQLMNQKQSNRIFIGKKLAIKVITACSTKSVHKFTTKLVSNNMISF